MSVAVKIGTKSSPPPSAGRVLSPYRRRPLDGVLDALTSTSPVSRELRQNAPFAGLLTHEEWEQILAAFIRADR